MKKQIIINYAGCFFLIIKIRMNKMNDMNRGMSHMNKLDINEKERQFIEQLGDYIVERVSVNLQQYIEEYTSLQILQSPSEVEDNTYIDINIDGCILENETSCYWQKDQEKFHLSIKDEYLKMLLKELFKFKGEIDEKQLMKINNFISADVQGLTLSESLKQLNSFFHTEDKLMKSGIYEQIEQELFYKDKEGIFYLGEVLAEFDIGKSKKLINIFSEELNINWKIPKILLPFYLYLYLEAPLDKRILDIKGDSLSDKLNFGLKWISKYPSRESINTVIKSKEKMDLFMDILLSEDIYEIKNRSLNLIYFNELTHLYDIQLMAKNIYKKDKYMKLKKAYSKKMYLNLPNKNRFDSIKNISDIVFDNCTTETIGLKNYQMKKVLNSVTLYNEHIQEKYYQLIDILKTKLKKSIIERELEDGKYDKIPNEIKDVYIIYKTLSVNEFYSTYIDKITKTKLQNLNIEGSKKDIQFFDCYYCSHQSIYEYINE